MDFRTLFNFWNKTPLMLEISHEIVVRTKTLSTNCDQSRSRCPETKKGVFEKLLIIERWVQIAVSSISRNVSHATKSCPVKIVVFQYNFYVITFFFYQKENKFIVNKLKLIETPVLCTVGLYATFFYIIASALKSCLT